MGFVSSTVRKIAFWNYPRTSWQWDVLCVLILVFIFLTPKSWFASTPATQTTVIWTEDLGSKADTPEIERRAKELVNRPDGRVLRINARKDDSGKVIAYEVDIR